MVVGDSKEEVMIFRDKLTGGSNRPFRCLDFIEHFFLSTFWGYVLLCLWASATEMKKDIAKIANAVQVTTSVF